MLRWTLRFIAFVVVALCLLFAFTSFNGWFVLIGIWFWPVIGLGHLVAHSIKLPRSPSIQASRLGLIAVSHVLLIVGFLLQVDGGKPARPILLRSAFDRISGGEIAVRVHDFLYDQGFYDFGNLVVFMPVFVSWLLLLILPTGQPLVAATSGPTKVSS